MDRAEVIRFLKAQRFGVVSSADASGAPSGAVVGIATTDAGEIVFDTLGDTKKAANLRARPDVAVTVWEGERTVQLEGVADEPTGDTRDRVLAAYLAAFPDGRDRLGWPGIAHFRVTPRWIRYTDFGAKGGPEIATFSAAQTSLEAVP